MASPKKNGAGNARAKSTVGKGAVPREEHEAHLAECEEQMLVLGSSRKAASEMVKRHGVARRTAQDWCKTIRERWAEEARARGGDREQMLAEHRERLFTVFTRSIEADNLATAHKVAVTLAQMDGFLTTIQVKGTMTHQVPSEQYEQAVAAMEADGWRPPKAQA